MFAHTNCTTITAYKPFWPKQTDRWVVAQDREVIMTLENFETGGLVVLSGYVLILVASVLMVRFFNKKIHAKNHRTV